jgi:hypothetical protein
MRKAVPLLCLLLLGAAWVMAQQTTSQSGTYDQSAKPGAPERTEPIGPAEPSERAPIGSLGQQATHAPDESAMPGSSEEKTIRGCLRGSSGNFTLTDDYGNTWQLHGDNNLLGAHVDHQVALTGSPITSASSTGASTGSSSTSSANPQALQVSKIDQISDQCSKAGAGSSAIGTGETSGITAGEPATSAEQSSATGTQPSAAGESQNAASSSMGGMSSVPAIAAGTPPPATSETPATSSSETGAGSNMSSNTSSTIESQTTQTTTESGSAPAPNQNSPKHISDQEATAEQQNLPQTASPLPLLALLGLGSVTAGALARRHRKPAA